MLGSCGPRSTSSTSPWVSMPVGNASSNRCTFALNCRRGDRFGSERWRRVIRSNVSFGSPASPKLPFCWQTKYEGPIHAGFLWTHYNDTGLADRVKAATGGNGIDVILDMSVGHIWLPI